MSDIGQIEPSDEKKQQAFSYQESELKGASQEQWDAYD